MRHDTITALQTLHFVQSLMLMLFHSRSHRLGTEHSFIKVAVIGGSAANYFQRNNDAKGFTLFCRIAGSMYVLTCQNSEEKVNRK